MPMEKDELMLLGKMDGKLDSITAHLGRQDRHHLIACDGMKGLSDPSVQCELEEQLQRCHSTPFTPG